MKLKFMTNLLAEDNSKRLLPKIEYFKILMNWICILKREKQI